MLCLRRTVRMIPSAITKGYPFESKRTINLFQKIFGKQTIRFPTGFDLKDYQTIYRFHPVHIFCIFSRRKYFLHICNFSLTFGAIISTYLGHTDYDDCRLWIAVGIFNLVTLIFITGLARNVIGRIYVNKDFSKVILSYGNSSGRRTNKTVDPSDLVLKDHPNLIYKGLCKRLTIKDTEFHCNLCNFQTARDDIKLYRIFRKEG